MVISFDLFGTLVAAERPSDPAAAVASELSARGVPVPEAWAQVYRESHVDCTPGAELSLAVHVRAALASCGVDVSLSCARRAVLAAFDTDVRLRPGAADAVAAAKEYGPVGVLSNCSVPGLVGRTLDATDLSVDAVVTSVDCGWRKPDRRAFAAVADELAASLDDLVHIGDDPDTDGGVAAVGGTPIFLSDVSLSELPAALERRADGRGDA